MTTFLIIDDDKIDRMIVERAFAMRYPEVIFLQASSIATALDVTARASIDHFLIDMSLSDGTGFDCIRAIKKQLRRTSLPMTFMSGEIRASDKKQALESSGQDIIIKPMRRSDNEKFAEQVYAIYESFASTERVGSVS